MSSCPRCQSAMETKEYDDVAVESCSRCGGMWLDADDLRGILDSFTVEAEEPARRAGIDLTGVQEEAACPECGVVFEPFNYAGDSGIILDKCPRCGGLWLDGGDLERILKVVAASNVSLDRDIKRFSADMHEAAVRQDALEQQDSIAGRDPLSANIASKIADLDNRP